MNPGSLSTWRRGVRLYRAFVLAVARNQLSANLSSRNLPGKGLGLPARGQRQNLRPGRRERRASLQNWANDDSPSSQRPWSGTTTGPSQPERVIRAITTVTTGVRRQRCSCAQRVNAAPSMGLFHGKFARPLNQCPGPERISRAIHRLDARIEPSQVGGFVSTLKRSADFVTSSPGGSPACPPQMAGFEISNLCSPLWENAPCFGGTAERHDVLRHAGERCEEGGELRDLKRLRVGRKDDVLVVQLHLLRKEVTGRIGEAY